VCIKKQSIIFDFTIRIQLHGGKGTFRTNFLLRSPDMRKKDRMFGMTKINQKLKRQGVQNGSCPVNRNNKNSDMVLKVKTNKCSECLEIVMKTTGTS
jgi:hypothetical protein